MSAVTPKRVEHLLAQHQHIIGVDIGDHRCTCGGWDWRAGPTNHSEHLAHLILENLCDAAWNEGYIHGYESPDMPIDFKPLSPYSFDRTPFDYEWGEVFCATCYAGITSDHHRSSCAIAGTT